MDLAQTDQRETTRAECGLQAATIFEDVAARVPFRKAEIQHRFGAELAHAAWARAEAMDKPRKFRECRNFEDTEAILAQLAPSCKR